MLPYEEIKRLMDEDKTREVKRRAQVGQRYYEGLHDIRDYKVFYFDGDGEPVEDKTRTSVKISHQFFTELVDQCTNYMTSGGPHFVKSDKPELQRKLDLYFDADFMKEFKDLLTFTQVHGFGYLYRRCSDDLRSRFSFASGLNVIEVGKRFNSAKKDCIIRHYPDGKLSNDAKRIDITRIEIWTEEKVWYFVMEDGTIKTDPEQETNPRPVKLWEEGEKVFFDAFDSIPFIRMDNNRDKKSELFRVKEHIDDYDMHACSLTNDIQDFRAALYLVRGYDGTDMNELMNNVRAKRIVGVGEDGGLDVKTIDIPYEARQIKLKLNTENIYKFGRGFDSSQTGDGNITNVVIKSRYANLDLKANDIEDSAKKILRDIITVVLDEINEEENTAYSHDDVYIEFERSIITNESDNADIKLKEAQARQVEIATLMSLTGLVGEEKVLELIGEVLDIDVSDIDIGSIQAARLDLDRASDELNMQRELLAGGADE